MNLKLNMFQVGSKNNVMILITFWGLCYFSYTKFLLFYNVFIFVFEHGFTFWKKSLRMRSKVDYLEFKTTKPGILVTNVLSVGPC